MDEKRLSVDTLGKLQVVPSEDDHGQWLALPQLEVHLEVLLLVLDTLVQSLTDRALETLQFGGVPLRLFHLDTLAHHHLILAGAVREKDDRR